jgi:integrase
LPGKRRDIQLFAIINRSDYAKILKKARAGYGSGSETGYAREPDNAIRDAALLAWEYLSGKRVSEFVGRKYYDDLYIGLTMDKWKISKIGDTEVLEFYIRILKRGRRKRKCIDCETENSSEAKFCQNCGINLKDAKTIFNAKEVWKWKAIRLDDPFTQYILEWLNHLKDEKYEGRIFSIGRVQAWRIMRNLGLMNHINRHWRATHLASKMDGYELKEFLDRVTIPVEYVHGEPTKQLSKTEEADKIWE